jgi:formylglycine-generating enzyme required for sulfatase activity
MSTFQTTSAEIGLDLVPIAKGGKLVRSDFLIARRPVTVREFQQIVGDRAESSAEDLTAKLAIWDDAIRYCNLLSRKAGRPSAYEAVTGVLLNESGTPAKDIAEVRGFRLPTGIEWDYAARGGRPDPPYADWGAVLDRIYWDDPTSHFANPIAPKEPVTNAIGLVGMLGYVREWYSHFLRNEDRRNRVCGWGHYYTNYDCFIAFHVTGETVAEGAAYPFRIALSADR